MKKKKIIIYTTGDEIFTFPIIYKICAQLNSRYKLDLFIEKPTFNRKFKVLITFILFSSISKLYRFYKKKTTINDILNINEVNIVNRSNKNYNFGISFNFPKKIKLKKYKIFNFHLGNFLNQRGSFIYLYMYRFKWKKIDLTFHEINKKFDSGLIIKKKTISIINKDSIDVCSLYMKNYNFIKNCLNFIGQNIRKKPNIVGKLNIEPSYIQIFKIYLKNFI